MIPYLRIKTLKTIPYKAAHTILAYNYYGSTPLYFLVHWTQLTSLALSRAAIANHNISGKLEFIGLFFLCQIGSPSTLAPIFQSDQTKMDRSTRSLAKFSGSVCLNGLWISLMLDYVSFSLPSFQESSGDSFSSPFPCCSNSCISSVRTAQW